MPKTDAPTCGESYVTQPDQRRFVCVAPPHDEIPNAHYFRRDLRAKMTAGSAPNNHHLESSLEAFFRQQVRLLGGLSIKLAPLRKGLPDRLIVMPMGRMYLVELKADDGALSAAQKALHAKLAEKGVTVIVLTGRAGIQEWLNNQVELAGPRFRKTANDD